MATIPTKEPKITAKELAMPIFKAETEKMIGNAMSPVPKSKNFFLSVRFSFSVFTLAM